ncbi:hypothetical protein C3L33_19599, partial [Rhododendron williamsianum]
MFNNEHQQQGHCTSIPRISFSSDFADSNKRLNPKTATGNPRVLRFRVLSLQLRHDRRGRAYRQGKVVASERTPCHEEEDDEYDTVFQRPPKSSCRWKGKLGLKRPQFLPKKAEKGQELYKRPN